MLNKIITQSFFCFELNKLLILTTSSRDQQSTLFFLILTQPFKMKLLGIFSYFLNSSSFHSQHFYEISQNINIFTFIFSLLKIYFYFFSFSFNLQNILPNYYLLFFQSLLPIWKKTQASIQARFHLDDLTLSNNQECIEALTRQLLAINIKLCSIPYETWQSLLPFYIIH